MKYTIGIDEVGRGCLAGPVVVCGCVLRGDVKFDDYFYNSVSKKHNLPLLKDSKQLTKYQRDRWFKWIENQQLFDKGISYRTAIVNPVIIDRLNISGAANLGAYRVVKWLADSCSCAFFEGDIDIVLDGGLFIKNRTYQNKNLINRLFCNSDDVSIARTVNKADEDNSAVSLASIVAKVTRDRLMEKMDKKHSGYGFSVNKGYGTLVHRRAIEQFGLTDIHRLTFTEKYRINIR